MTVELVREKPVKRDLHAEAVEVIEFLNKKAGRNYRPTKVNTDFILARLKEGYTLQDCKSVIAMKVREWSGDDVMNKFLRPATLFNCAKFNQYAGELVE
jgi:uncharacterized phage protein (TIGR02220 family)